MSIERDSLLLPAGAAEHVLIQLYSPHSDPCRRLVPHFEALAKRLVRPHRPHPYRRCRHNHHHERLRAAGGAQRPRGAGGGGGGDRRRQQRHPRALRQQRPAHGLPLEPRRERQPKANGGAHTPSASRTAAPLFSDGRGGMGFARRLRAARTRWWSSWLGLWRRRQPQPPRVNSESL